MKSVAVIGFLVVVGAGGKGAAQVELTPPIPTAQGTLRSIVTVRDGAGAIVSGLAADRFSITIEGQSAAVSSVRPITEQWLAVAMLIDKSGSMKGRPLAAAKEAAKDFVRRCGGQTLFAVVPFDEDSLPPPQFLRADQGVGQLIDGIQLGNNTALYDAILTILPSLADHWAPRKAMIALTDGKDTRSKATFNALESRIKGSAVPVYTVGLGNDIEARKLEAVAAATGGRYLHAPEPSDLIRIYQAIAAELESGYVVEFEEPGGPGATGGRQLVLTVQTPGGPVTHTMLFEQGGEPVAVEPGPTHATVTVSPKEEAFRWEPVAIGAAVGLLLGLAVALIARTRVAAVRVLAVALAVLLGALAGGVVSLIAK
ncbi:VWA domain-containing protein [Candidatus Fermentibacteria bacterium]|nr:VWA domain-containing protein [Candidatus Fermentibacteria bacterium]